MTQNRFQLQRRGRDNQDSIFETLVNRFCGCGWVDAVVELPNVVNFHFTKAGKKRFRAIHAATQELERDFGLLTKDERAELLEIVEAWMRDVESQVD